MNDNNQNHHRCTVQHTEGKPHIFKTLREIDLNLLTIFEAVYVHKGIVNAAKILNLTPSAISQSIQKLRAIFPDPLFIRKGQGVTPTAFADHLHEYISQGLASILGALDISGSYEKQRTITIATSPSVGALVMPVIYEAIKARYPHLLLRNLPLNDAETQLTQFQTDLTIDNSVYNNLTIQHHVLFSDHMTLVCRKNHALLSSNNQDEIINKAMHTLLLFEDQHLRVLRQRVQDIFPDREISFSSYNFFTIAALVASSDLLAIMPHRLFSLFNRCWSLEAIASPELNNEQINYNLHFNKLSLRDPVIEGVVEVIRHAF